MLSSVSLQHTSRYWQSFNDSLDHRYYAPDYVVVEYSVNFENVLEYVDDLMREAFILVEMPGAGRSVESWKPLTLSSMIEKPE